MEHEAGAQADALEQLLARHRRELKDLQGRITSKKKNASKKTRRGVNEECAQMERDLRERQAGEVAALRGDGGGGGEEGEEEEEEEEEEDKGDDGAEKEDGGDTSAKTGMETNDLRTDTKTDNHNEEPASRDAGGAGAGAGGAGTKKRNRQKERMARRAAEQEAAMERAEQEASRMTDHRARESEYMRRTFGEHGLVEQEIAPDGHCLFSAVADQLAWSGRLGGAAGGKDGEHDRRQEGVAGEGGEDGGKEGRGAPGAAAAGKGRAGEPAYKMVRRAAAEYMAAHEDDFAPFVEGAGDGFAAYVARMRDTAEWGGQLELMALARRYGVEIRVIQDGRTERIAGGQRQEGDGEGGTFWLAYYRHGYGLGEHYNSLRMVSKGAGA